MRLKNPLLEIVKRSKFVEIKPDFVDDVPVTRLIVDSFEALKKLPFITWACMELLDKFSGFYGYRITIRSVTIKFKL